MCIVCTSSSSFNLECTEENPVYQEYTNEVAESIPSELVTPYNTYGKDDKDTDAAAEHITRGNYKWDDDNGAYGGNILGEAASITYGYSTDFDSNNVAATAAQKVFVEKAISAIQAIANITFTYEENSGSGGSDPADIDIESIPNYLAVMPTGLTILASLETPMKFKKQLWHWAARLASTKTKTLVSLLFSTKWDTQ